jgi:hypothetical protein
MPAFRPMTIAGIPGKGYIEAVRNERGGLEGFGEGLFSSGGGDLLRLSQSRSSLTYRGSVWIDGVESRRSLEVFFSRFNGERGELTACHGADYWQEIDDDE